MAGNTFGNLFKITTFGESHGKAIGIVIDGCPSGLKINERFIQKELKRRRPGQSQITTQRNEDDKFEILSGVFNGKTTGTPLTMLIYNLDQHSSDYENIKLKYRPSHADYTYDIKYGIRDFRGGGRSSARETAARVLGGAIAKLFLKKYKISIEAYVSQVGNVSLDKDYTEIDLTQTEKNIVRCPDNETALKMISLIESVRNDGDTIGGTINCVIKNCPAGLGEPVFDKLQAQLARAMLSINAAKGFEYGSGFNGVNMKGSEHNDIFIKENNKVVTLTNNSGGIQGGISNGMDIYFKVAFKPVATLLKPQQTIDIHGNKTYINTQGRHDPCVVPRAVPVVEAMAAFVIADFLLINKAIKY